MGTIRYRAVPTGMTTTVWDLAETLDSYELTRLRGRRATLVTEARQAYDVCIRRFSVDWGFTIDTATIALMFWALDLSGDFLRHAEDGSTVWGERTYYRTDRNLVDGTLIHIDYDRKVCTTWPTAPSTIAAYNAS